MEKHTEGKLLIEGRCIYQLNEKGVNKFCALVQDAHTEEIELQLIARRLVACWNACNGIGTDELEKIEVKRNMRVAATEYAALSAERDALLRDKAELLESLQKLVDRNVQYDESSARLRFGELGDAMSAVNAARALLTKHGAAK